MAPAASAAMSVTTRGGCSPSVSRGCVGGWCWVVGRGCIKLVPRHPWFPKGRACVVPAGREGMVKYSVGTGALQTVRAASIVVLLLLPRPAQQAPPSAGTSEPLSAPSAGAAGS
jgi:hypothetical protein